MKLEKLRQERMVVLLYNKITGSFLFYGNLKALFEHNDATELGISYNYLRNRFVKENYYENDKIIIHKGIIQTSTRKK